ncbi:MAG: hypothetical protein ACHQU0_01530 [Candidatus Paceibacteria bacterium]
MEREEIKSRIVEYFKRQIDLRQNPSMRHQIQFGNLVELFRSELNNIPHYQQEEISSMVNEIVHDFAQSGLIYFGLPGDGNSYFPWITITEHGKAAFVSEDWLPYDPDGYIKALKAKVPELDDVTLAYVAEAVSAFNRQHLLAATITLGVASENLMVTLIEAYQNWIPDARRKSTFQKKTTDRWIASQYGEFKKMFPTDVKSLPKKLQGDWETYLDGVFNFIRINRNSAGHPTGKQLSTKVVYANLQMFAEYARYVYDLIAALK